VEIAIRYKFRCNWDPQLLAERLNSHLSRESAIRKTLLFAKVGFREESATAVHGQLRTAKPASGNDRFSAYAAAGSAIHERPVSARDRPLPMNLG